MSKMIRKKFVSPLGVLKWVTITGEGKEDLNGDYRYCVSVQLKDGSSELKAITAEIEEFWQANKPKGITKQKSNGIRVETEKDDEGEQQPTGYHLANFWTRPEWKDGKPKVIRTYNARNNEVALGDKAIGNDSEGRVSGIMAIYSNPKLKEGGVSLHLNSIQLFKFVEYTEDTGFMDESETCEDGWTGEDLDSDFGPGGPKDEEPGAPKVNL